MPPAKAEPILDGAASLPTEELVDMYRRMMTIRVFEEGAERLHTEAFLSGPFHSSMGQEAVAVGVCSVLGVDDMFTSTHRGHGHLIAKGGDIRRMLAELKGRSTGYSQGMGGSMHLADISIGAIGENGIVGGSMFLATGAALGFQLEGGSRVAVAFFGDGGVGQGIFHECLNLAAIWRLPVVFVCENNQYAHSFPARDLSNGGDIAGRAAAYGCPGVRVDGTDALEVRRASQIAVDRARRGEGPSLIEAVCYRWRGHNLNDSHLLYRSREEVDEARKRDPVAIMRAFAGARISEEQLQAVDREVQDAFEAARVFAENSPPARPETVFDQVIA
jgi:TPP-dependent pyruvate/acetoin dehydrogenase alpha subunit